MTHPKSNAYLLQKTFFTFLLALGVLCMASAESASGTWTGLDKSNFQGQLREVTLTLRPATTEESAILPRRSQHLPAGLEKQILAGEFVSSIPNLRRGQTHSETQNVVAAYFPKTQSIVLYFYMGQRVNVISAQIGVLDPSGASIAFFHTGMAAKNSLPFVLARGIKAPSQLEKLAGLKSGFGNVQAPNPFNAIQAANQQKAAQKAAIKTQQAQQAALKKYAPQLQELQRKMLEALQAGDQQTAQQYRTELQELAQTIAAIQRGEIPSDSGVPAKKPGNSCPEHFLQWTAQVEANGDKHENFEGLARVANLFRDEYFVPYFKKPFDEFGKQEGMGVARSFRSRCLVPTNSLYHSKIATSLSGAFMDGLGFGRFDAASAAQALDLLAEWQKNITQEIERSGSLAEAEAFELQRSSITAGLWPREQEEAKQAMAVTLLNKVKEEVFAQLEKILVRLEASDVNALSELTMLKKSELYKKIPPEFIEDFDIKFWQKVNPTLATYLQSQLQKFANAGTPRQILEQGNKWYRSTGNNLATISDQAPYKTFVKTFSIQREDAYLKNKATFIAEIEAIDDRKAALAFDDRFFIPLDNAASSSWRDIKNAQEQRIKQIEWEAHLARVGDGPFGPNYPGAIYLNAIYRGDTAMMNSEDGIYHQKLITLLRPLLNDGMLDAFGQLFTGGMFKDFKLSDVLIANIKQSTILDQTLAYLVVHYYNKYPQCRSAHPAKIPVTTVWTTVTTWSDGYSSEREDSRSTEIFLVNPRHEQAWRKFEGNSRSPEKLRFLNIISQFIAPKNKDLNIYDSTADTLEGLRTAMDTYPCDHDVIQTLEANMLAIYAGSRRPALNGVRTSWKNK